MSLHVECTIPEDHVDDVREAAKENGLTVSQWAKMTLSKAAKSATRARERARKGGE